ncbi:MAG: RsiV family protein [Patescibacteria group bacterium]
MRVFPTLLLTSLLITGAGCFKTPEPTVLPEQPERESENMVGDVPIETVEIQKDFVLNEFAECKVHISYPSFGSSYLPPLVSAQSEHEMSQFIAAALNYNEDVNSMSELEEIANAYVEICRSEIESEYNNLATAGEELFMNLKRTVDIVYNIKLNQFHLLTVGLDEYSYTGGAHSNQRMQYINIDRGGDQLLSLDDIIKPEHLKVFLQYEKAQLLADNRESLYPEVADEYDALIEDLAVLTSEQQLDTYGSDTNFFLTPTSIVTYYNSYDIAPYAAGPIFVEIPFTDIKDYISLNGPLVPLVENL